MDLTCVRTDEETDEGARRTNRLTDGRMDIRTDGPDGRINGRTDERTEGRTDIWPDGRTDGRTNGQTYGRTDVPVIRWVGMYFPQKSLRYSKRINVAQPRRPITKHPFDGKYHLNEIRLITLEENQFCKYYSISVDKTSCLE